MDLYANSALDDSGFGEGERYLGFVTVQTGANGNGAFTATFPVGASAGEFITATATNPVDSTSEFSKGVPVIGVRLFYNGSAFDGNGPTVSAADFAAIAPDMAPVFIGETATFTSISGYSRGINGIFVDVADLPNDGAGIDAADFVFRVGNNDSPDTWAIGPAPTSVGVMPNAGTDGADRIFITFADGDVADAWLRLTLKPNSDTGVSVSQDFFFGSARGETGAGFIPTVVGVDAADLQFMAENLTPLAAAGTELITARGDVNRDRSINAFDFQVVAKNLSTNKIRLITPQITMASMALAPTSAVPTSPLALAFKMSNPLASKLESGQFVARQRLRSSSVVGATEYSRLDCLEFVNDGAQNGSARGFQATARELAFDSLATNGFPLEPCLRLILGSELDG